MKQCNNKNHPEDSLYCTFCEIVDAIFGEECCPAEKTQNGDLMVIGEDSATITLKGEPKHVKVDFKDSCNIIPCNPNHFDELEWEVVCNEKHHGHKHNKHQHVYTLHITWNVSGVREIAWTVCY